MLTSSCEKKISIYLFVCNVRMFVCIYLFVCNVRMFVCTTVHVHVYDCTDFDKNVTKFKENLSVLFKIWALFAHTFFLL